MKVISEFQISFSTNTFVDADQDELQYSMMYSLEGSQERLLLPSWLTFEQYSMTLKGEIPQDLLFKKITFYMAATDGIFSIYQAHQDVVMLSWQFVLLIIGQIGGPITFLLALYTKKALLYEYFCQRRYKHAVAERIMVKRPFAIAIPLIETELALGAEVFRNLRQSTLSRGSSKEGPSYNWVSEFLNAETGEISKRQELVSAIQQQIT